MTTLAGVPERDWPFDMAKLRDEAEAMMRTEREADPMPMLKVYKTVAEIEADMATLTRAAAARDMVPGGDDARFADEWRE